MKLRDCLSPLNALFILRDSQLSKAIYAEFAKDLRNLAIFTNDSESAIKSCYKQSHDIAFVEITACEDLQTIEEARYANPRLEFVAVSDSEVDLLILQCLKMRVFAFVRKCALFERESQKSRYNLRELEIILAHFALFKKSNEIVRISPRIAIECANEAIYLDNRAIFLSPKLKKIFWLLYANANRIVPYERILSSVFDMEATIDSLRMSIVRLKKRLQNDAIIANISGEGYMLVCESCAKSATNLWGANRLLPQVA